MWGEQQTLCGSMELGAGRLLQAAKHESCLCREEGAWALSGDALAGSPNMVAQMQCHACHRTHLAEGTRCPFLLEVGMPVSSQHSHSYYSASDRRLRSVAQTPQGCCQ